MHKEQLEQRAAKRRRRENIQQAVLGTLALTGALAVIAIAPALPMALASITGKKHLGYRAKTATGRLAQKGLVTFETRNGMKFARLTPKGVQALALEQAKVALAIRVKKRWDRRYRMVIFDIPQKRRLVRDQLRHLMRDAGFFRLQQSVWVHPYDCEELIALIKAELKVGKDILYAIVEEIENDQHIKDHFGL